MTIDYIYMNDELLQMKFEHFFVINFIIWYNSTISNILTQKSYSACFHSGP